MKRTAAVRNAVRQTRQPAVGADWPGRWRGLRVGPRAQESGAPRAKRVLVGGPNRLHLGMCAGVGREVGMTPPRRSAARGSLLPQMAAPQSCARALGRALRSGAHRDWVQSLRDGRLAAELGSQGASRGRSLTGLGNSGRLRAGHVGKPSRAAAVATSECGASSTRRAAGGRGSGRCRGSNPAWRNVRRLHHGSRDSRRSVLWRHRDGGLETFAP